MKVFFHNLGMYDYWLKNMEELRRQFPEIEVVNGHIHEQQRAFSESDILITRRLSCADLKMAKQLKVIFTPKIGYNDLPLQEMKERNITLCNVRGQGALIAERAIALAFTLMGKIVESHNALINEGIWRVKPYNTYWTSLQGKSCAVLGLGTIGSKVADFLHAFHCHVIGFRKSKTKPCPSSIQEIETDLFRLIEKADVLFICLPLNEHTRGLIDKKMLANMQGKFLINVGRAEIIDEGALYKALSSESLAGYASDVWVNEPENKDTARMLPSNYPIHELENVVVSPHCANFTKDSKVLTANELTEDIKRYLTNCPVVNQVGLVKRLQN